MMKTIPSTPEAWDQRQFGADEAFAAPAPSSVELDSQLDQALALRMISIRLPEALTKQQSDALRKAA